MFKECSGIGIITAVSVASNCTLLLYQELENMNTPWDNDSG